MLKVGTEISLLDKSGKKHKSYICCFVYSREDNSVFAVTSAAFTNMASEETTVSTPDHLEFGTISAIQSNRTDATDSVNRHHSSFLFGYIKIKEEAYKEIDIASNDHDFSQKLKTTQRLYTDLKLKKLAFYVSVGKAEISLPDEAFSFCDNGASGQSIVQGLGIVHTMGSSTTNFLSGTPLLAKTKTLAGMIVAGSNEKGFAVVPMSMALRDGIELLTAAMLPMEIDDDDILSNIFERAFREAELSEAA